MANKITVFIESLTEDQKQILGLLIQYESINLWFLQVVIGGNLASSIAVRRSVRKYKNLLEIEKLTNI